MSRAKNFLKKIIVRQKLRDELICIETVHPYLELAVNFLVASQKENGSWMDDVLITSLALRALYDSSRFSKNEETYKEEINRASNYLKEQVANLTNEILSQKHLYAGLDKISHAFGNALYTLWSIGSFEINIEKTREAFKRLTELVSEYSIALSNVDSICSLLNCYLAFYPESERDMDIFRRLLTFVINRGLSYDTPLSDVFMILYTLTNLLDSNLSRFLENAWFDAVRKRPDEWKNENLKGGLSKLALKKFKEITQEHFDIKMLCYGLLVMCKVKIEEIDNLKASLLQKLFDSLTRLELWRQILKSKIGLYEIRVPLHELSLVIWSLSASAFAKIVIIPVSERETILSAIRQYRDLREGKSRIMKNKSYYGMIVLISILIFFIFLLLGILFPSYCWVFGLVGLTISLTTALMKIFK